MSPIYNMPRINHIKYFRMILYTLNCYTKISIRKINFPTVTLISHQLSVHIRVFWQRSYSSLCVENNSYVQPSFSQTEITQQYYTLLFIYLILHSPLIRPLISMCTAITDRSLNPSYIHSNMNQWSLSVFRIGGWPKVTTGRKLNIHI